MTNWNSSLSWKKLQKQKSSVTLSKLTSLNTRTSKTRESRVYRCRHNTEYLECLYCDIMYAQTMEGDWFPLDDYYLTIYFTK